VGPFHGAGLFSCQRTVGNDEAMATADSAQPINPRTLRGLRQLLITEVRGLVRTCFRAFWMTTLFFAVPGFLYFTLTVLRGQPGGAGHEPLDAGTRVTALLVYAGMSLFYGAHGGLVAAVLAGLWRLFGGWMFLPVGVTLAVFLGLGWLSEGLLSHQVDNLQAAITLVRQQQGFPETGVALSGARVAHAGGPIVALLLLITLPFLLAEAIVILLAPKVLWELALLAVLVGGLFLLATVLTLVISLPVLGWSLVKRVRARHQFAAPSAQPAIQG